MTTRLYAGLFALALAGLVLGTPHLQAEEEALTAARLYEHGMAHLQRGELEAALAAFQQASARQPDEARYSRQALVVKRVIGIRKYVAEKPVSEKWERMVATLHAFYLQHQSHAAALDLNRRAHPLLKNAASEARLAEALLAAGQDAEAIALLTGKAAWKRTPRHATFLGIALARRGHVKEARTLAAQLQLGQDADPTAYRDVARLDTLLGDHAPALAKLTKALAGTPATAQEDMRNSILQCPDFAVLFDRPGFKEALKTPSQVDTTSCSGGADCGSCPKRGGCGKKK